MTRLQTLDLPSYAVGFDRLFGELERSLARSSNYPPYNVAQVSDDEWIITIAVAGFDMNHLNITLDKNVLSVEGTPYDYEENVKYLHKGIGGRSFRRCFTLADHIEVKTAELKLGMLHIQLKRNVPEELQPKKIAITQTNSNLIQG